MKIVKGLVFSALMGLTTASLAAQPPQVLTTLKPLQLIAEAITDGISTPEVLLAPGASPHDYALKPSDSRKLANADVLMWIGPDMEAFLTRSAEQRPAATVLTLADVLNLKVRGKEEEHHDDEDHEAEHEEADHHDEHEEGHHHHGGYNPHMWTSPALAIEAAHALTEKLREADPSNASRYVENFKRFEDGVNAEDARIKALLAPVKSSGYYVFHDAYHYFEEYYGLNHLGEFTVNPERTPGAKHLSEIRHALEAGQARCVFTEPQFTPAVVEAITRGLDVHQAALDPLATDIKNGPEGYEQFLDELAHGFANCLAR